MSEELLRAWHVNASAEVAQYLGWSRESVYSGAILTVMLVWESVR